MVAEGYIHAYTYKTDYKTTVQWVIKVLKVTANLFHVNYE